MSSFDPLIYCPNPACPNPLNHLESSLCHSCQTPLIERFLWAIGSGAEQIQPGEKVADRYQTIAPQVWLDTRPGLPQFQGGLPDDMIPYLQLYPRRLHVPEVFGSVVLDQASEARIFLLENVPVDTTGHLCPSITHAWVKASAVRQVYWLWQILQLWTPLSELEVASSLLVAENLRVEGWRVRLLELLKCGVRSAELEQPSLRQLGECWQAWITLSQVPVAAPLQEVVQQMVKGDVQLAAIAQQLNQLLLSLAAELPVQSQVAGGTDTGPQRSQNEDTCYPTAQDLSSDPVINHLTIVCDGIGGHEGGEVASQLAVQSLKLQVRALLAEVAEQTEVVPPDLLIQQLEASLRVVNNLIAARNDAQGRSSKQRMGTTLVMAVQVPQSQTSVEGVSKNGHELYLAHIGDSRAYWITRDYCLLLTVDDNVATREVRNGRSLHREALQRPDAGGLTQALGTRDAEFLHPTIQRFVVEEDGLLLLCSDGLSDNGWVEHAWRDYAAPVLEGKLALADAVRGWIDLANLKNGHDNTSVVITHYRTSNAYPLVLMPKPGAVSSLEVEFSEASRALMATETAPAAAPPSTTKGRRWLKGSLMVLGFLGLLLGGTAIGVLTLRQLYPNRYLRLCQKLPESLESLCPRPVRPIVPKQERPTKSSVQE